jgi:AcrR family transcriptional regulator
VSTERRTPAKAERLPREERRAQIVRAAARAFLRGGFDGTSMEDVAREAGVTRLIVYRIFESKEDLYRAVLEGVVAQLVAGFSPASGAVPSAGAPSSPGADPDSRGFSCRVLLTIARRDPDAFRLFWVHAAHEPAYAEYHRQFRVLADAYAASLLQHVITDPGVMGWAAPTIVAHVYDAVINWLDHGDPHGDEEFIHRVGEGMHALVVAWAAT